MSYVIADVFVLTTAAELQVYQAMCVWRVERERNCIIAYSIALQPTSNHFVFAYFAYQHRHCLSSISSTTATALVNTHVIKDRVLSQYEY